MNVDEIRSILDMVREHDLSELELELEGVKLRVKRAGSEHVMHVTGPVAYPPAPVAALPVATGPVAHAVPAPAPPPAEPNDAPDLAIVKSPIVGTFYRSPEPGAPPFAEKGQTVKKGQVLCIIEAMKLMNEIESDYAGEIVAAYVENGQAVQFGERLFAIRVK
jgi:acetyl-CoA carboxylase biotin carboxyl carrier protein